MSFGIISSSYTTAGGGSGSQYASEVLADSPLLYWRLGETSGPTATDSSGNGRHGTYSGSPVMPRVGLAYGEANGSVYFNESTGDYASLASASWMNVSDVTVTCAVVLAANGLRMLASRYHDPNGDRSWFLYTQAREFKFYARDASDNETIVSSGFTAIPGEVYFVAGYSSGAGAGIRVYDKTGLVASVTGVGRVVRGSNRPFMIMRSDDGASYQHEAYLDEVTFYGTVLSTARLDAHAAAFFEPRPWLSRSVAVSPRNGTTSHTLNFTPAANGSLLVMIVASSATIVPVSAGWTEHLQPIGSAEVAVFTKVAAAGESTFSLSQNNPNRPVSYAVYEFKTGSTYHSGVSHNNGIWPAFTGLPGTSDITVFCATGRNKGAAEPTESMTWYFPLIEDIDTDTPHDGVTDGVYLGVSYQDEFTYTAVDTPIVTISNAGAQQAQNVIFAISVAP